MSLHAAATARTPTGSRAPQNGSIIAAATTGHPIIAFVTTACQERPPALLQRGIEQFNRGEFFEQHETLEDLWREEPRPIRELYRGILQIGVAMYHIQRGNHHGAVYMLTRGQAYLQPFAPSCQGVDVADLLDQAARALSEVERLGRVRLARFDWSLAPQVRAAHPTGNQPGPPA